jgi:penicillin-binding protein 2
MHGSMRYLFLALLSFCFILMPSATRAQKPSGNPAPQENTLAPSWETQKSARTFVLQIPAPRGQITDRSGAPLAQTRVSYNLAINFPTPLNLTDNGALSFAHEQMALARSLIARKVAATDEQILKHYHNRGVLPMDVALDLQSSDVEAVKQREPRNLSLHAVYQRFYPGGALAGHILGYAGRAGRALENPIQNNDLLWPASEGRDGLEQTFNDQLTGKNGQLNMVFDVNGRKASEKIAIPPQPGYNVVTTLDAHIQQLAEEALSKGAKRGALVVVDPNNGDILAMASTPCYNPNAFVPAISAEAFKALQNDPNIPLLPRAFRSAYPPGSTFKVTVGLAALESGSVSLKDEFGCPGAMQIGNMTFRNWKHGDSGSLDFVGALTQSCDTWFYQVGLKTGAQPIIDWSTKMGFGAKTGIPLASEAEGRVPTQDYMRKVYGRKFLDGDIANLSIGQGDLLVTPLQMAEAMAAVGNGGTLYRARLVQQVQSIESQIVTAYEPGARETLDIQPKILAAMKKAMVAVVSSPAGTAGRAQVDNVEIAGKTGTAQWGPKKRERNAAWFAGFAPADKPRYAFAALYESEPNQSAHGGTYAAPMIHKVMQDLFKDESKSKGKQKSKPRVRRAEPVPTEESD